MSIQDQLLIALKEFFPNATAKKINKDNFLDINVPDLNVNKGSHIFFNTSKGEIKVGFYCRDEDLVSEVLNRSNKLERYSQGVRILDNPSYQTPSEAMKSALSLIEALLKGASNLTEGSKLEPIVDNRNTHVNTGIKMNKSIIEKLSKYNPELIVSIKAILDSGAVESGYGSGTFEGFSFELKYSTQWIEGYLEANVDENITVGDIIDVLSKKPISSINSDDFDLRLGELHDGYSDIQVIWSDNEPDEIPDDEDLYSIIDIEDSNYEWDNPSSIEFSIHIIDSAGKEFTDIINWDDNEEDKNLNNIDNEGNYKENYINILKGYNPETNVSVTISFDTNITEGIIKEVGDGSGSWNSNKFSFWYRRDWEKGYLESDNGITIDNLINLIGSKDVNEFNHNDFNPLKLYPNSRRLGEIFPFANFKWGENVSEKDIESAPEEEELCTEELWDELSAQYFWDSPVSISIVVDNEPLFLLENLEIKPNEGEKDEFSTQESSSNTVEMQHNTTIYFAVTFAIDDDLNPSILKLLEIKKFILETTNIYEFEFLIDNKVVRGEEIETHFDLFIQFLKLNLKITKEENVIIDYGSYKCNHIPDLEAGEIEFEKSFILAEQEIILIVNINTFYASELQKLTNQNLGIFACMNDIEGDYYEFEF